MLAPSPFEVPLVGLYVRTLLVEPFEGLGARSCAGLSPKHARSET